MPVIDFGQVALRGPKGDPGEPGAASTVPGPAGPNAVSGATTTPFTGVLAGNGTKVVEIPNDDQPTEDSQNIVRSGSVFAALQRKVNRNLAVNAYFPGGGAEYGAFPINIPGQSTYVGAGYAFGAWYLRNDVTATLTTNGLQLTAANSGSIRAFNQPLFGLKRYLIGKTVTISALVTAYAINNGDAYPVLGLYAANSAVNTKGIKTVKIEGSGLWTTTMSITANSFVGDSELAQAVFSINFGSSAYGSLSVAAMKVEIGDAQTLAHQEDGVWVLNEIPDYEDELIRTLTYRGLSDPSVGRTIAFSNMIAPVEEGLTPSQQYTTGKIFIWQGKLYKAKATISTSTPFNPPTNCEETTLAALLNM